MVWSGACLGGSGVVGFGYARSDHPEHERIYAYFIPELKPSFTGWTSLSNSLLLSVIERYFTQTTKNKENIYFWLKEHRRLLCILHVLPIWWFCR